MKKMSGSVFFFALCFIFEFHRITANGNEVSITVPSVIDVRDYATISCSYDIGFHRINSIKWWKDGKEFYRFTPFQIPNEARMTVKGVKISERHPMICNEKICKIHLEGLSSFSSGIYKCEIAGDAPTFKVIENQANMTVLVLPKRDPVIFGLSSSKYKYGDVVSANCTSDISSVAANLQWYIDDQKATSAMLKSPHQITNNLEGFQLHYKTLELQLKIDKSRFHGKNQIKLQCVSKIDRLPNSPPVIKETTTFINVIKPDDLRNQKLTDVEYHSDASTLIQSIIPIIFAMTLAARRV